MSNRIYQEIRSFCAKRPGSENIMATCHTDVASMLLERDEAKFKQLEEETNTKIFIRGDSNFHYEQFVIS